jgi:hypothetical protein
MKFKNTSDQKVTFTLDKAYEVEPGATIDISDNVSFAVKSMGLPLETREKHEDVVPDLSPRISNKQPTAADKSSVMPPAFHVEPPAPNAPIPGPPPTEATQDSEKNAASHKSVRPKQG